MRVGFDIGGTFTDVIVVTDEGGVFSEKILSLPETIGDRIVEIIDNAVAGEKVEDLIHATTTASNAIIERKTARTGLLCTKGFRDDLEMRGQRRPSIYDTNWDRLPPLIERRLRLEIDERILGDGTIDRPIDLDGAEACIRKLMDAEVEAIAICLVNSYLNDTHERQLKALVSRLAPHLICCASCDIDPEIGEYERASTTTINASLVPIFDRYMNRLERQVAKHGSQLMIMQSDGGVLSAASARRKPANLIESGPAAGVLAAAKLAKELNLDKILSFDLGGTTAKACLIENGQPFEKSSGEVGGGITAASRLFGGNGYVLRVPWLDIVEVGAGGGSLAWIEHGKILKVGPQSAGAEPGPVCYGRGGRHPTLTDANVVLGYINPQGIAGGTISIDRAAAATAIDEHLASPLGIGVLEAAHGITRIANSTMMRALRAVSTERGRDPREFTLMAFGGGGPLHAAALAEMLDIRRICVPIFPGLFSALGLLFADCSLERTRGVVAYLERIRPQDVYHVFDQLEREAMADLGNIQDRTALLFRRQMLVKYNFQASSIAIEIPSDLSPDNLKAYATDAFTDTHIKKFGHVASDPLELVSLRVRVTKPCGTQKYSDLYSEHDDQGASDRYANRDVHFGPELGTISTPVRSRSSIASRVQGSVVIEQPDTTIVVPPGWSVYANDCGTIFLER